MIGRFQRICERVFSKMTLWAVLAAIGITSVPATADAQSLLQASARYPRIRMLDTGELIATVLMFPNGYNVKVFSSTNNGATWTAVGNIVESNWASQHTSSPDFVVMPNGDLILGINTETNVAGGTPKIRIFKSTNKGRNWSYLSTATIAPAPLVNNNDDAFWEPNFSFDSNNNLVLTYADETSACCSQKLMKMRSLDGGLNWSAPEPLIKFGTSNTKEARRPGMPIVVKLTDGTNRWMMTYELCNVTTPAGINCRHYYKTSTDGWNYGSTTDAGTALVGNASRYFNATPMVKPIPTTMGGGLLWIGRELRLADGTVSAANGVIMFKSPSGSPNGPWNWFNSPISLPAPANSCEGFSPALQWVSNGSGGTNLVQMTTRYNSSSTHCDMYVRVIPMP